MQSNVINTMLVIAFGFANIFLSGKIFQQIQIGKKLLILFTSVSILILIIKSLAFNEQFYNLVVLTILLLVITTALSSFSIVFIKNYSINAFSSHKYFKYFLIVQGVVIRAIFPILTPIVQAMLIFEHSFLITIHK